jgi:hypothetical protein
MSTLDKLKQKLRFDGASKGLTDIGDSAKKVDMSTLGNGIEQVRMKFSAMEIVGMTALANITNSAINTGKRMISALTIDPVKTGFNEYEMKMDSVKTIMASTGEELSVVNKYLEELNEYSDQTIYSFADMTQNIGKFTNAGVKLEDAVLAIKGISNEAALSGANANEASRAMYNFAQALSVGYIQRIDWKSIELANMATVEFKEQLLDSAIAAGTVKKNADGLYETLAHPGKAYNAAAMFTETLDDQWLTTEVLISTLKDYSDASTDVGKRAYAAAQDVTKASQMFDILKETAQSGWAKTWEIIVGDLNSAKAIFTPLTDFFSGIITTMDDARNRVLKVALAFTEPWNEIKKKLEGAGLGKIKKVAETVGEVSDTLEHFQNVVTKVWRGDFNNIGDNPDRRDLLTKAGYDPRVVQDLVNKGYQYKLTMDDVKASHEKFGLTMSSTAKETKEVSDALAELTDQQLKDAGLTKDEIKLYRALQSEADKMGISFDELTEKMSKTDGRTLLIESFKNIGDVFVGLGKAAAGAWNDIFNPPGLEVMGIRLWAALDRFKEFTDKLRFTNEKTGELNETGKKFQRIFKGVFAVVDLVATVIGGPLKLAFNIATELLKYFNIPVLDVVANVADAIVKFHDWVEGLIDFEKVFDKIVPPIKDAIEAFKDWIDSLKDSKDLPKDIADGIASAFGRAFRAVRDFFKGIPDFFKNGFDGLKDSPLAEWVDKIRNGFGVVGQTFVELGRIVLRKINEFLSAKGFEEISADSIAGLVKGFGEGASKVWDAAVKMVSELVAKVKEFLGIHSPSRVFMAIGGFIIAGLVMGLKDGIPDSLGAVKDVIQPILDYLGEINWGGILAGVIGFKAADAVGKISSALNNFSKPAEAFAGTIEETNNILHKSAKPIKDVIKSTSKVLKGFSKVLSATAFDIRMDGIKKLVLCILMLVGAVIVLSMVPQENLWKSVLLVGALAAIMVGLAWATDKISAASTTIDKNGVKIKGLSSGLLGVGLAILAIAGAVMMLSSLDRTALEQGMTALGGIAVGMVALILAFGVMDKLSVFGAENFGNLGKTMLKLSITLLLMVGVIKLINKLDPTEIDNGLKFILGFMGFIAALMVISMIPGKQITELSGAVLKIAGSMLLMIFVTKLAGGLKDDELLQALKFAGGFSALVLALAYASSLAKKHISEVGKMMIGVAGAMLIMVVAMKLIGTMKPDELVKGLIVIGLLAVIIGVFAVVVANASGGKAVKAGATILAFAGAIGILVFICMLCGLMSYDAIAKGLLVVGALSVLVSMMVRSLKGARNITGTMIAITVAIGLLVGAMFLLTLLTPKEIAAGTAALSVIMVALSMVVKSAGKAHKATWAIVAMSVAIGMIGAMLFLLSGIPFLSMMGTVVALSTMLVVIMALMKPLTDIGRKQKSIIKGAQALAWVALPIAGFALTLLLLKNVNNAIPNVLALVAITTAMTYLTKPLSEISKKQKSISKGAKTLLWMVAPLASFALTLLLLKNVNNALSSAVALTAMTAAMVLLMKPLSEIGKTSKNAITGVILLTTMAVPLLAFVGILGLMQGIDNALNNVIALSLMATVMTGLLYALSLIANMGPTALGGVIALAAMAIPLGLFVALIYAMSGIENCIEITDALTKFMLAMSVALVAASVAGLLAVAAVTGILALTGVIVVLGALIVGIGALMQEFPQIQSFLDTGIPVMIQLASGIGEMVGAFIAAIANEVMETLPKLGMCLSMFMMNATGFIVGAKMVDEKTLAGVGILAAAILALVAADLIAGIVSFFKMGSSFADLGTELSDFWTNASGFIEGVSKLDESALAGINSLAGAIITLTAANVLDGLASLLGGGASLKKFGEELPHLGTGLRGFSDAIGEMTQEQLDTVEIAAEAVKKLASASAEIPNTGGLLGALVGENDLGAFADQFPNLGEGIRDFLAALGNDGLTKTQIDTVEAAAGVIKTLASAAAEIPNAGGLLAALVGENNLETFADQFPHLGEGIVGLLGWLGDGFGDDQVKIVERAADCIKSLANAAKGVPSEGGWIQRLVGSQDLGDFSGDFEEVGKGIRGLLNNMGNLTDAEVNSVGFAAEAIGKLADGTKNLPPEGGWAQKIVGGSGLENFATQLPKIGKGIRGFADEIGTFAIGQIPSIEAAVEAVTAVAGLPASLNYTTPQGLIDYLGRVGTQIKDFIGQIAGIENVDAANANITALKTMLDELAAVNVGVLPTFAGTLDRISQDVVSKCFHVLGTPATILSVTSKATTLATAACKAIENKKDSFGTAGHSVVTGFANGITEYTWLAEARAKAMAQAAIDAARELLKINSPSKVFRAIGYSVPEGFAMGIDGMSGDVRKSAVSMADTALGTVSNSIARIAEMVNSDVETQPTIRPVMDLSNVRSGVSAMNGMLNMDSSVGVRANLSAISSSMSLRGQNGANAEVVNAIDKLRKELGNVGNTTSYTINGVTYDDGSNISDAVRTLVRAATMERRV